MQPRRRHIVFVENSFDGALRNTGFTVDAFIWVDVDHVRVFVKAIAWANLQANPIFAALARFSHDHRHNRVPPVRIVGNKAGTGGGEKLDNKADSEFQKFSDSSLTNRASHELVSLWLSGSQDAARILLARYEVRLIALVASRLNRKYRDGIAPEDVVQSAMGSFFRVTRAGANPSIKLESTASAWNILATFVRRKLARALERETAAKRGGVVPSLQEPLETSFLLAVVIAFSTTGLRLARLPLAALIGFHAFRLPLELILHNWYKGGTLPVQMTYEGHNFDIATGILAVVVGTSAMLGQIPPAVAWIFNVIGTSLLAVVMFIALTSSPFPFRQYMNEPQVLLVYHFPFSWIVSIAVAGALLGHLVLFRKLLKRADCS